MPLKSLFGEDLKPVPGPVSSETPSPTVPEGKEELKLSDHALAIKAGTLSLASGHKSAIQLDTALSALAVATTYEPPSVRSFSGSAAWTCCAAAYPWRSRTASTLGAGGRRRPPGRVR